MRLTIRAEAGRYGVAKLDPAEPWPPWIPDEPCVFTARTRDERSIICREGRIPAGPLCERGWRLCRVVGPFAFETIGVMSAISGCLAAAEISLLSVSTFDTDYFLVRDSALRSALAALRAAGHDVGDGSAAPT